MFSFLRGFAKNFTSDEKLPGGEYDQSAYFLKVQKEGQLSLALISIIIWR